MWKTLLIASLALVPALPGHAQEAEKGARERGEVIVPEDWQETYDKFGYAPAVRTEDGTLYLSGVIAELQGDGAYRERYAAGLRAAFSQIEAILAAAGAGLDDVVKLTTYHTDIARQVDTIVAVRKDVMDPPHPAWTAVGTPALATPDGQTEIEVIAEISGK